jgi:TM2 domain-containing membrane protein YozV
MLVSCLPTSKPFIKFQAIPSENHFPEFSLSDTVSAMPQPSRDTAYINALVHSLRLNEAQYLCNAFLVHNPTEPLSDYVRFKRFKIQFLQQIIGNYEVSPVQEFDMGSPRVTLCGKSISKSLNSFLMAEGVSQCAVESDTTFESVGYPTEKDVWFLISLIADARKRLETFRPDTTEISLWKEKTDMLRFLDAFEPEVVSLGVWKFIQNGSWDSASAYCDFMSPKYPDCAHGFQEIKSSIASRPKIKNKSKTFAGISSAIIPGAGQFYNKKYSSGLWYLAAEAAQVSAAMYLLKGADYKTDRSEVLFGAVFSITSVATHISNIKDAISKAESENSAAKKDEIKLFVKSLRSLPPGVKRTF